MYPKTIPLIDLQFHNVLPVGLVRTVYVQSPEMF